MRERSLEKKRGAILTFIRSESLVVTRWALKVSAALWCKTVCSQVEKSRDSDILSRIAFSIVLHSISVGSEESISLGEAFFSSILLVR